MTHQGGFGHLHSKNLLIYNYPAIPLMFVPSCALSSGIPSCLLCSTPLNLFYNAGLVLVSLEMSFLNFKSELCWKQHFWITVIHFQSLTVSVHAFLALTILMRHLMSSRFQCHFFDQSLLWLRLFGAFLLPLCLNIYLCVQTWELLCPNFTKYTLSMSLVFISSPSLPWLINFVF